MSNEAMLGIERPYLNLDPTSPDGGNGTVFLDDGLPLSLDLSVTVKTIELVYGGLGGLDDETFDDREFMSDFGTDSFEVLNGKVNDGLWSAVLEADNPADLVFSAGGDSGG